MMDDEKSYRGSMPRSTEELREWHQRSLAEGVLDAGMPIVDSHHHLYGGPPDANFYRMEDLERDLQTGHRILGTVYMEAYLSGWHKSGPDSLRSVGEIEMILRETDRPISTKWGACNVGAAIVSNVDLTLGNGVEAVLETHVGAAQGRLRGVRHHLATDTGLVGRFIKHPPRAHLLTEPSFRLGFSHLRRWDLSFDAWLYHNQLGELLDIAQAYPDIRIVVNHLGTVMGIGEYRSRKEEVLSTWRKDIKALSKCQNVTMKIGGMGMPVYGFGFELKDRPATSTELAGAWQSFVDEVIEAFGPHRCLFESNFPVDSQSCGYLALWNAFKLMVKDLSEAERRALFYKTACRTYRLPELEALGDRADLQVHA